MRVNARFDGVAEQQVEYLAEALSMSVSEVLRLSVAIHYQQVRGQSRTLRHFGKHIGRYRSGESGTAAGYKADIARAVEAKHSKSR